MKKKPLTPEDISKKDELLKDKNEWTKKKSELDEIAKQKEIELNSCLLLIGNIVDDSVPVSMDEKDNAVLKLWWPAGRTEEEERARRSKLIGKDGKGVVGLSSHHEVLERIEGYDSARGKSVETFPLRLYSKKSHDSLIIPYYLY